MTSCRVIHVVFHKFLFVDNNNYHSMVLLLLFNITHVYNNKLFSIFIMSSSIIADKINMQV